MALLLRASHGGRTNRPVSLSVPYEIPALPDRLFGRRGSQGVPKRDFCSKTGIWCCVPQSLTALLTASSRHGSKMLQSSQPPNGKLGSDLFCLWHS
jgi:hypothetical protein